VKAHNYTDAINLLRSGALLLLQHKQSGSGTDLALYLIEVYNLEKTPVTEESRGIHGFTSYGSCLARQAAIKQAG